jgi:hypothetical protein
MATETNLPVVDRIQQLLQRLGIERTHVAGSVPGDCPDTSGPYRLQGRGSIITPTLISCLAG